MDLVAGTVLRVMPTGHELPHSSALSQQLSTVRSSVLFAQFMVRVEECFHQRRVSRLILHSIALWQSLFDQVLE